MDLFDWLWAGLAAVALANGLVLAVCLWRRPSDRFLTVLVVAFVAVVAEYALLWTETLDRIPHMAGATYGLVFVFGPCLYLYGRHQRDPDSRLEWRDVLHLVPFLVMLIDQVPYLALPPEVKAEFVRESLYTGAFYSSSQHLVVTALSLAHLAAYLVATLAAERRGHIHLGATLRRLFGGLVGVEAMTVGLLVTGMGYSAAACYALPAGMTAFGYGIGFVGLRRLAEPSPVVPEPLAPEATEPRYGSDRLSDVESQDAFERVETVMRERELFRESDLRLDGLASASSLTPRDLSQVVNREGGVNVNAYINRYRVEAAAAMLRASGATVLEVAYASGFNSKSAFHAAFRLHTGQTPSAYRKNGSES